MDVRYHREQVFHNNAFAAGTRRRVDKFYSVARDAFRFYESAIKCRAAGRSVLEYGCGADCYSLLFSKGAALLTGIDLSDVGVDHARTKLRRAMDAPAQFSVMNAEALGFQAASFDMICGVAILHHLDLKKAYAELSRVLRPNGVAVFLEPLGHNPVINGYRRMTPSLRTPDEHPLLMSDLALAREYFGVVETHFFTLSAMLAFPFHKSSAFTRLLNGLNAVDRALFAMAPFFRRYAWQTVMVLSAPTGRWAVKEGQ